VSVDGVDQIVRKLRRLRDSGADKAATSATRAAARVIEKGIKDAIPGQYRDAKKAVGRRVRNRKGKVVAKVGAGVGKRPGKAKDRTKRGGVGLSKNNIHWAILGVQDRQTKSGSNRGQHGGFLAGVVQQGASNSQIRAAVAMREAAKKEIEKAVK